MKRMVVETYQRPRICMRRDRWKSTSPPGNHSQNGWFDYATNIQANAIEEVCSADISEEIAERLKAFTVRASRHLC